MSMQIFVDTEFSSLGSDPRLISIALVAVDGTALYIEFQSGWSVEQCSAWVKRHVLPQLGAVGEKLDRRAAVERIDGWLSHFARPVELIVDSSWDRELIDLLYREDGRTSPPTIRIILFANRIEADKFEAIRQDYFAANTGMQHHALNDANALRFAVSQSSLTTGLRAGTSQ